MKEFKGSKGEYQIELTKEHFRGDQMHSRDCVGTKALEEAIGEENIDKGYGIYWLSHSGYILNEHRHIAYVYQAYTAQGKGIGTLDLTEQDIGTTIHFKRVTTI